MHLFDTVASGPGQQSLTIEDAASAVASGTYRAIVRVNNQQARSSPRVVVP